MGESRWILLATWAALIQLVVGGGKLEVKFVNFDSGGGRDSGGGYCDALPNNPCDPFFAICLDRIGGTANMGDCSIYQAQTRTFHEQNGITFGTSMQGVANPIIVSLSTVPTSFNVKVKITDADPANGHDHMDTIVRGILDLIPGNDGNEVDYIDYQLRNRAVINIKVRTICDRHYFGPTCTKKCKNNELGSYTCDKTTGDKICAQGWTGENCNEDINECEKIACQNGATCQNVEGSYGCMCADGFEGWHCENPTHQCAINPCNNGGTCHQQDNSDTQYICVCPPLFNGATCDEPVDPCSGKPCQNGASCIPSNLVTSGFMCSCESQWTGEICDVMLNISSTTSSTVTVTTKPPTTQPPTTPRQIDFTGDPYVITLVGVIDNTNHWELERGLENLIQDLGEVGDKVHVRAKPTVIPIKPGVTTTRVEFFYAGEKGPIDDQIVPEIFRVHGDDKINPYLPLPLYRPGADPTVKERQTGGEDSVSWYFIALPILIVLILAACILAFILIRRRRRPKDETAEFVQCDNNVQEAPQTHMAFENILYREANRQQRDSDVLDGGAAAMPNGNTLKRELPPIGACADELNPYMQPVQYDTPLKMADSMCNSAGQYQNSNLAVLDTRGEAGANDYTDFNNLDGAKAAEENHYQELDEVTAQKIALSVGLPDDLKKEESDGSVMDSDEEDDIDKIKASFKKETEA